MGTVAFYIIGSESRYSGTSWVSESGYSGISWVVKVGTVAHHGS